MIFQVTENKYFDNMFMEIVVGKIRQQALKNIDPKKLILFVEEFKKLFKKPISDSDAHTLIYRSVLWGVRNLKYRKHKDSFQIFLPPHVYLHGTKIPIAFICELIDAGTLDIPGTHIFSNAFHDVHDKIDDIYYYYFGEK